MKTCFKKLKAWRRTTKVSVRRPSLPEVKNKQKEGAVPAS